MNLFIQANGSEFIAAALQLWLRKVGIIKARPRTALAL